MLRILGKKKVVGSPLLYGTRRGLIALGTALPVGIGAVFGAGANSGSIRKLARDADAFFATLPYSAIDVDSTDITDRRLR